MYHVKLITHSKDIRNILNACNMCNNNNNIFYYLLCIYINHDDTTLPETCNLLLAGYCCAIMWLCLTVVLLMNFYNSRDL